MNQNDKNKLEKFGMTHNQIVELKALYVERYVDNMSTKDLVAYVMDDLDRFHKNQLYLLHNPLRFHKHTHHTHQYDL